MADSIEYLFGKTSGQLDGLERRASPMLRCASSKPNSASASWNGAKRTTPASPYALPQPSVSFPGGHM